MYTHTSFTITLIYHTQWEWLHSIMSAYRFTMCFNHSFMLWSHTINVQVAVPKLISDHVHLLSSGTTFLFGWVHFPFRFAKKTFEGCFFILYYFQFTYFSFVYFPFVYFFHSYTFHSYTFFIRILFICILLFRNSHRASRNI